MQWSSNGMATNALHRQDRAQRKGQLNVSHAPLASGPASELFPDHSQPLFNNGCWSSDNSFVCSWMELQRLAHPAVQKTSFEIHSFGDRRELQAITALQLLDDDVVMAFIAQTIG